jgi:hypothetical protein
MRSSWPAVSALAGVLVVVGGCGDQNSIAPEVEARVTPMCQLGCQETDPFPAAPGVFLTSVVTPDNCFYGGYTDLDQDDLGDLCEERLVTAFAPELAYGTNDQVGREPYWAAQSIERVGGPQARLMYLLSYHVDLGVEVLLCRQNLTPDWVCEGHYGDSEYIVLDVYYDDATQHWVLGTAYYSAHGTPNTYDRGTHSHPPALTYPDNGGAYPRAYVSYGKHANYASISECNAGGFLGLDQCLGPWSYARVPTAYY